MTGGKDKGAAGAGCGGRQSAPDMPPAPLPGPRVTRGDQTRGRGSCRAPGSLPLPSTWGLGERGPRVFINPARRCRCCRRLPPDARRETGAREGNLCSPVPPLRDQTGDSGWAEAPHPAGSHERLPAPHPAACAAPAPGSPRWWLGEGAAPRILWQERPGPSFRGKRPGRPPPTPPGPGLSAGVVSEATLEEGRGELGGFGDARTDRRAQLWTRPCLGGPIIAPCPPAARREPLNNSCDNKKVTHPVTPWLPRPARQTLLAAWNTVVTCSLTRTR